ncbi:MAG: response regulator [Pirellulales bacterium]
MQSDLTSLLLVEDDPLQLRIYKHVLLREFGADIDLECFSDSDEALARIQRGHVDILLTDLQLPGVGGLRLLRELNGRNRSAQALMMTATSTSTSLLEALEYGAVDYLLKPIDHELLIRLVRQADDRLRRWRVALAGTLANARS